MHLAEKHLYVIWFTEGLKHEGSSNWRWKTRSSKCPPWTKTYSWNEFAKSHLRAQTRTCRIWEHLLTAFEASKNPSMRIIPEHGWKTEFFNDSTAFGQQTHQIASEKSKLGAFRYSLSTHSLTSAHSEACFILANLSDMSRCRFSPCLIHETISELKHEWLLSYHPPYPADFRAHGMFSCFRLLHGLLYPHTKFKIFIKIEIFEISYLW